MGSAHGPEEPRSLLLTGEVGAGKTTTAEAVGDLLEARGIPGAVVDLDAIRRAWPAPAEDRFLTAIELRNLRELCRTYREAGARVIVAAGVIEDRAVRAEYAEAMGAPLTVVRLRSPREAVRERLRRRHAGDPDRLEWHQARFDELAGVLDRAVVEDVQVEVRGTPPEAAASVLSAVAL